jgi:hypothetical protein
MAAVADDTVPSGPGAVLSFLREGAPSALAEVSVAVPAPVHVHHHAEQGLSARCGAFVEWLDQRGFEVVVFDMDRTMSSGHCGQVCPAYFRFSLRQYFYLRVGSTCSLTVFFPSRAAPCPSGIEEGRSGRVPQHSKPGFC